MGNFDNYYKDRKGCEHREIPLGTSPADAYVRTNLRLENEISRIDMAIQERDIHIDTEISRVDEEIRGMSEAAERKLAAAINEINNSMDELSDAVNERISADIAIVDSRVDNIIAHNSDTEGNTELIDIRTGADGTVYASAGQSVRGQINAVNDKYAGITCISRNLVDISDFSMSKVGSDQASKTLAEPLPPGTYTLSLTMKNTVPSESNNNFGIRYYCGGSSYIQIGGFPIEDGRISAVFTAEESITRLFFFMSSRADAATYIELCDIQIESGDTASPYRPHIIAFDADARNDVSTLKADMTDLEARTEALEEHFDSLELYTVNSFDELAEALANGGMICLGSDITASEGLLVSKNCMIFGNGHSITGDGLSTALMLINNGKKVELHDLNLYSDGTYNVVCTGSAVVLIDHCTIQRASNTVCRFTGSSNVTLRNCDIGYSSGNDGIAPGDHASVYIYNCYVHDNYDEGVSTHNSSYCEVHGGEFCRNGYVIGTDQKGAMSSFGGVHLGGGRMGIVEGIYSHDNCTYGIGVINFQEDIAGDIEKIYNNLCENNGGAGIWLTGARGLTLSKNTIINNGGDAIHFGRDSTHTSPIITESSGVVADNTMYGNANDNVVIDEGFDGGLVVLP